MAGMASLQVGSRVEVTGKGTQGTVAFIGSTSFSAGKWIGVILDEPKGKNNGTVQGKSYFQCKENHGTFVRMSQLSLIDESGNKIDLSSSSSIEDTPSKTPGLKSRFGSSRHSISSRTPVSSRSREDVSVPMSAPSAPTELSMKKSSFVESPKIAKTEKLWASTTTPKLKSRIPKTRSLIGPEKVESSSEQTGFVETLCPQFIPGLVLTSPSVQTQRTPQATFVDPIEHEGLRAQVKDLTEKLETMRMKHKEKMHEIDALKLKLDQSAEFKIKIMESQAVLKKEIEQIKKEKEAAVQAHDDLSDIAEALEMATLDKEMAEEKVESLQMELTEAKERIEELTLDFELLKAEFDKIGESSGEKEEVDVASSYQLKQLEQQNVRLRETLVKMRDLSAHEKHEIQKLQKDLEEKKQENGELRKSSEKQQSKVIELEALIAELHEQVDAALGAEEMVEQLGLQKLTLEDKIKELEEAVFDLEALQEVNDQLQDGSRELELQLREEVDLANAATREALREKENALEALADRELTIVKFRELVQKLQDQCQELQIQLQKESVNHDSMKMSIPEMLDFKKMFAETKAQARAIDLEIRRMEVNQCQQHIQYLVAFIPDTCMVRGGDNDAVLTLILITRLLWKCEILLSQIRDKFPSVELSNKGELVKGHTAEQYASRCRLSFHLHLLEAILRQFSYGLNTCTPEVLLKVGASFPEMSQQEKILDAYIEMLKTDQLDENVRTENLEKCVTYFNTMHTLLLLSSGDTCLHQTKLLLDHTIAFSTACESIRTDVAIMQALIQSDDTSDMSPLCQHLATVAEVMQQHLKQIRRRISAAPDVVTLPIPELATNLLKTGICVNKLTKALRDIAKTAFSQIALTTDEIYLSSEKLIEICTSACEKIFDEMPASSAIACIKNSMNYFANEVANVAQAIQEAESYLPSAVANKPEKVIPPIILRATQVKKELEQIKILQAKLESKENDVKELRMLLKTKQEEIGELNIRKDIAEKKLATSDTKLANITRDYELSLQKLQRKLDEANQLMKRKETEFEQTMDHLQADIDSLECEKGELKDRLKTYSKKVLIEGIAKNVPVASGNLSIGGSTSVSSSAIQLVESPLLVNEILALRRALERERSLRYEAQNKCIESVLDSLEPIPIFKQDSELDADILRLEKEARSLVNDMEMHELMSLPKIVDISKRKPGADQISDDSSLLNVLRKQAEKEAEAQRNFQKRYYKLKEDYAKELLKRRPGSQIKTDLTVFPTPEAKKLFHLEEPVPIGKLILPLPKEHPSVNTTKIVPVDYEDLNRLASKLSSLWV